MLVRCCLVLLLYLVILLGIGQFHTAFLLVFALMAWDPFPMLLLAESGQNMKPPGGGGVGRILKLYGNGSCG